MVYTLKLVYFRCILMAYMWEYILVTAASGPQTSAPNMADLRLLPLAMRVALQSETMPEFMLQQTMLGQNMLALAAVKDLHGDGTYVTWQIAYRLEHASELTS